MNLNPAQAAAAHDVTHHVLVAAGAGTGKTQCVVGRLLYALGEDVAGRRLAEPDRLGLGDVAAITFTNVAAADLQRKLRAALRAAGRREDAERVDTARIGTIHAFCGQILREVALQLDRSPGLYALQEAESLTLAAESAREVLLGAVEGSDVPGLGALLEAYEVEKVLGWAARLAGDTDRLTVLEGDGAADQRERAILALARRSLALMRQRLHQRSALDFDSMIGLVRDLLRDRPDVRRVLQRRIRLLIIDEFQDVDPAQQEIAWLLGEPDAANARATRLMLVGDPKQSIFRFRRADVTVWTRVQRAFEAGAGAVHALTENFRSRRPILGLVDAVLGPELDAPVDLAAGRAEYEVPAQPLVATAANDVADPCVELLALPPADNGKMRSGDAARAVEIPAVARRARELVDGGTPAGDIAILLPAWGAVAEYGRALRDVGVASWTLRNEGYWERREVLDCVVALHAVLDPLDDLALVGVLRGPMVGVKDETLLELARSGHTPYWPRLEQVECDERELLAFGAGLVRRYATLRDRLPHDELLQELLDECGYVAYLRLLGDDGRQAEANVRKLIRILRGWRELPLADVLRTIAEVREREEGTREGDAPLESRADSVTITSIHSAKGLEWPVVIWADLTRGSANLDWHFVAGRTAARLRSPDVEKWSDDARFKALRDAEELEQRAERKRLWYVAATRAKERLIVAGVPQGEPTARHVGTAAAALRRLGDLAGPNVTYRDYSGMRFEAEVRVAAAEPPRGSAAEPLPVLPADTLWLPPEPVRVAAGRARHSASELLTFSRCRRKHWFTYQAGLREPPVDRASAEFLDAVTRGQIVHDVLEHLREQDELDRLLEDAIGRWDPDGPPPEGAEGARYRSHLREEIGLMADHPAWRALAEAPGARRELGFVRFLGEGRWLQGRIDLIAPRDDGGLAMLDVKTSRALSPEAARKRAEGYAPQRDVYVGAVEGVSGREVAEFGFLFSRAGAYVSEELTHEVRVAGVRGVDEMVAGIEAGERGLTASPVECRFCGYRRAGWCEGVRAARSTIGTYG
jgi:ATP-dependent helicase/nuclease subunit A